MIVHRVLGKPEEFFNNLGNPVWGVLCLLEFSYNDVRKDIVLFEEEEHAWKFFHESQRSFHLIRIEDESNSD